MVGSGGSKAFAVWAALALWSAGCVETVAPPGAARGAGGPCALPADCDDSDVCTVDVCEPLTMTCSHTAIPLCCNAPTDCDDGLVCTLETCILNTCGFEPIVDCDAGIDVDGALLDGELPDAEPVDAGEDAALEDAGEDAGPADAGVEDAGVEDAGEPDAAIEDAGVDAGEADAGPLDAATPEDSGEPDSGSEIDAGAIDAGDMDSGAPESDGGVRMDAGSARDGGADAGLHVRGGACAVSRAGGVPGHRGAGWLTLAALLGVALAMRWRWRRAALIALVLATAAVAMAMAAPARAQLRVDHYPAPPHPDDLFWLERAAPDAAPVSPHVRLSATFADDPLIVTDDSGAEVSKVIGEQVGLHLSVGLGLAHRIFVSASAPFYFQSTQAAMIDASTTAAPPERALGDPAADLRLVLLDRSAPFELSVAGTVRIPVGETDALISDDGINVVPRLLIGRGFGNGSYFGVSGGVALRPDATFGDLHVGTEAIFAAGMLIAFTDRVGVTVEAGGSTSVDDLFDAAHTPIEATGGLRYTFPRGPVLAVGGGAGLTQGYGAPDARVLASIGYHVRAEPPAPVTEREVEHVDPDADDDGILDHADHCPREAEDVDEFQDMDGCPETDNDRDGVPDSADHCPNQPEDRDQHEDEDGCPDDDNDGDRVPDAQDRCKDEPEDRDSFQDDDGCPDPDNDNDGRPDGADQCPNEPETMNGRDDEDGCPDLVRVEQNQIRTLEPIYFVTNSDRIQSRSHPLLAEMAAVMKARAELGRISIEGHTDNRGSDSRNQRLSERRASSVMRFLTEAGVPADRLESHGFGESRPIEDNHTPAGRALNRRVEFRFLDRAQQPGEGAAPGGAGSTGPGPGPSPFTPPPGSTPSTRPAPTPTPAPTPAPEPQPGPQRSREGLQDPF